MNKTRRKKLITAQRNEITEHYIYLFLAERTHDKEKGEVLRNIADDELRHYGIFKKLTNTDVSPRKMKLRRSRFISRMFGLSFGLKLMESGERVTQKVYADLKEELPELADVLMAEQKHEMEILSLIGDNHMKYSGSVVLGLNDALVELTGALAGLTFALQDTNIIAMTGSITGVAASMSMAASEFLSSREEADGKDNPKNPLKSAGYTGVAYIITVLLLIIPYLIAKNVYFALALMLAVSIMIIMGYNFYISVIKNISFWRRFGEMTAISLGIATISFFAGLLARQVFGVDV